MNKSFRTGRATAAMFAAAAIALCVTGPASAKVITMLPNGVAQAMPAGLQRPNGPLEFTEGVTYDARTLDGVHQSSLFGYTGAYSFAGAGSWSGTPMASFGISTAIMSFTFADPVSAVLAEFNWARTDDGPPVTFRVFDDAGNLLEKLSFAANDPNYLTGFYGFQRAGAEIGRFEVEGYWVGTRNLSTSLEAISAVPEPATWAMMIVGLGGVGAALRFRRSSPRPASA
jgi:hypothetical protein